jgi:catechol 2,3-dioxygenase-like lactoylglutathione lyase family enzyme
VSQQPAATAAPSAVKEDEVVEKAVLHHVGINVTNDDFEKMIDWYRNILDLEINYKGHWGETQMCFLVNDEANHRVVFVTNPALGPDPQTPHARLNHTAYEFPTVKGLLAKYAQLRDQEIYPYMSIDHGLTLSIYYSDPNGYGIELQADSFADWAKSSEYMRTSPDFQANPVGILFDPELVIEDVEKGLTVTEIHERCYHDGAYPPTPEQRQRLSVLGVDLKNMWDHPSWGADHPTFAGL